VTKVKAPRRSTLYFGGERNSLTVRLKQSRAHKKDICLHNSFVVHSPTDHPLHFKDHEFCEFGYGMSIDVLITPKVIYADEELRLYPKEKRHCMYTHDGETKTFKAHTQKNCEMETLALLAKHICKCAPYFLLSSNFTRTCWLNNLFCVRYWQFWTIQREEGYDLSKYCWPACNSIKYNVEIIPKKSNNVSDDEIVITFKFKEKDYTAYRRFQSFQLIDFISQSGSILGLFAGVSMLSFVELFYLIGLRNITNVMRMLRRKIGSKIFKKFQ